MFSQDNSKQIESLLNKLKYEITELDEKIDISVSNVTIQELVRGIGNNVKINIVVDPGLSLHTTANFTQARVADILLYLCKQYDLDLSVTGNIISISKYNAPPEPKVSVLPRKINVTYNLETDQLTMDLNNDTLSKVVKEIISLSNKNIVLASGIGGTIVNGYIKNVSFENALDKLTYSNNLLLSKTKDDFYVIEKAEQPVTTIQNANSSNRKAKNAKSNNSELSSKKSNTDDDSWLKVLGPDSISVFANNRSIEDILLQVSDRLNLNYYFVSDIIGTANLNITNATYEDFLSNLFSGTSLVYKKQYGVYLFGDKKLEELKDFKMIQLQHRAVEKIKELIPADIAKPLEIIEFDELNGILLSGSNVDIANVENFIREIDKVVPVILIEVMIVDYSNNRSVSTGFQTGLDKNVATTDVTYNDKTAGGLNIQLGTNAINEILGSFSSFSSINLGKVSPRFYFNIKALESNGIIKIRSTPKLAALNGHEAKLISGETKYYKEQQNSYYGSLNAQLSTGYTWKPLNADLSITIKPFVSGNDQVTLDIDVTQSEFTVRESTDAPPGSVKRSFKSIIRVKNEELILLGGLDKNTSSTTSEGLPIIARIPILKWIFGNVDKSKTDRKSVV